MAVPRAPGILAAHHALIVGPALTVMPALMVTPALTVTRGLTEELELKEAQGLSKPRVRTGHSARSALLV